MNIDWFGIIEANLRDCTKGNVWSAGIGEILCKTESAADALADIIECLYEAQGENVYVNTGYYDPVEDERSGEVDSFTGWWYVSID